MTEDEKLGFEHGCRVMIKMMKSGAYMLRDKGMGDIGWGLFGFADYVERDVDRMAERYASIGYEAILQEVKLPEDKEEK